MFALEGVRWMTAHLAPAWRTRMMSVPRCTGSSVTGYRHPSQHRVISGASAEFRGLRLALSRRRRRAIAAASASSRR